MFNDIFILTRAKLARNTMLPLMEPVIGQLIEKLADGNARLREGARKGLDLLAASPQIGPGPICHFLTKPLPPKQKTNWRPIASRLEILTGLVTSYGLGQSSGLSPDTVLNFPKSTQAFSHSNGEVRDAAKDLVVAVQRIIGTPPLEPTLSLLRKKQLEEYKAAFENKPVSGDTKSTKDQKESPSTSPMKRTDMSHQHAARNPAGKVNTSAAKVTDQAQGFVGTSSEGGSDFTVCMFCGTQNKSWSENDLDLHYWMECPLLISCPSCTQIVEIAGLPEHLLDECEHKSSYLPCEVTGIVLLCVLVSCFMCCYDDT
jgi:centrosomal protein CEP104